MRLGRSRVFGSGERAQVADLIGLAFTNELQFDLHDKTRTSRLCNMALNGRNTGGAFISA